MSIRSRIVSLPKNKLISNNEQLVNATDLSPYYFRCNFTSEPTREKLNKFSN